MLQFFVIAYCFYLFFTIYTSFMQIGFVKDATKKRAIILSTKKYHEAANYSIDKEYSVEVVTKDPDNTLVDKIVEIPTARFNRSYLSDGLYHSVFVIIF